MENFKYFTQDGARYILHGRKTRSLGISLSLVLISIPTFMYAAWWAGAMFIALGLAACLRFTKEIVFDTARREIIYRESILREAKTLPFDAFTDYSLDTFGAFGAHMFFIAGAQLIMNFDIDGKTVRMLLWDTMGGTKFADAIKEEVARIMKRY